MNRLLVSSFAVLLAAPSAARAQVYPERIVVKAKAAIATAYQRRDRADSREEQTEKTTRTFHLGPQGSLMLGNIAGDITVTRGGGADVTVEIVKTARGRDVNDARDALQNVTVDAVEQNGRAEVKTHYPNESAGRSRRNLNVSVAYTVTAPPETRVSIETISGNVRVTGIKGDLTATSISGDVRVSGGGRVGTLKSISGTVELDEAQVDGAVEASSVSGDVVLRRVSARRSQSGTVSGNIRLEDLKCDRVEAHTTSGNIDFSGPLAKSGHYELKGFSGDIHVMLAGNTGFELDASSFSGQIRSDDFPITTRGRIGRRTLTGTYGDGSAILDLSTFSGGIVITKR